MICFKAPQGYHVFLEFTDTFDFLCMDVCSTSYVEVKRGPDMQMTGYRFCCNRLPSPIQSDGNEMLVMFRGKGQRSGGFHARYRTDGPDRPGLPPPTTLLPPSSTASWSSAPPNTFATVAPGGNPECGCQPWSAWDACDGQCGGCGYQRRQRYCQ